MKSAGRADKVLLLSLLALPQGLGYRSCLEPVTSRFCSNCGSQVPRYVKETDFIVIPAGSLDSEPPISPQARIFWGSRASRSRGGGDPPVYSEYPTS